MGYGAGERAGEEQTGGAGRCGAAEGREAMAAVQCAEGEVRLPARRGSLCCSIHSEVPAVSPGRAGDCAGAAKRQLAEARGRVGGADGRGD